MPGTDRLIVHARKAVLGGLSPHENRTVPPLRFDVVAALKAAHPRCAGGGQWWIQDREAVLDALDTFDGVMIGREAYHRPELLAELHAALHPQEDAIPVTAAGAGSHARIRALRETAEGTPLQSITRHPAGPDERPAGRPLIAPGAVAGCAAGRGDGGSFQAGHGLGGDSCLKRSHCPA